VAQGADKDEPMAGVPYDGKLTRAQGKGQWWDGLDPQDLYEQRHAPGRQAASQHIIQADNAGRDFRQLTFLGPRCGRAHRSRP